MTERLKVMYPVIVEGKYDKNTLLQIIDTPVIATGGFSVFNSKEKQSLLMRLAEKGGLIILTDSDSGGNQIRRFLQGILPKEKIYNLYTPEIRGKEKRKKTASKSGILGVEGMDRATLEKLFRPFVITEGVSGKNTFQQAKMITKLDFFEDGLSGGKDSSLLREKLALHFDLPRQMSAAALIEALNIFVTYEEYKSAVSEILTGKE